MPETFLHGVELLEIDTGVRPISSVRSSVIGIIGTAPLANATKFPINTPVLLTGVMPSETDLGVSGTLYDGIKGIFDQAGAVVVVVRVTSSETHNVQVANLVGSSGDLTGVHAFEKAQSVLGVEPRILIAPGFTTEASVLNELLVVANKLRSVIVADAGVAGATPSEAQNYANDFDSNRIYMVYPQVKVSQNGDEVSKPASSRVAGIIAKTDNDKGFWWSPSNQTILGIVGTDYPVGFVMGEPTSLANILNEQKLATIINVGGFRLWGNRTLSSDAKWVFLQTRRTADIINDSLLKKHLWAVDRNITKTYISDVTFGVNSYLNDLVAQGAILGGKCWADPDLNTPTAIAQGKVYFSFDFTPPYPAEHITFRSLLTLDYLQDVV